MIFTVTAMFQYILFKNSSRKIQQKETCVGYFQCFLNSTLILCFLCSQQKLDFFLVSALYCQSTVCHSTRLLVLFFLVKCSPSFPLLPTAWMRICCKVNNLKQSAQIVTILFQDGINYSGPPVFARVMEHRHL